MSGLREDKLLNACHLLDAKAITEMPVELGVFTESSYGKFFEKIFDVDFKELKKPETKEKVVAVLMGLVKHDSDFKVEVFKRKWLEAAQAKDRYYNDLSPKSFSSTTVFFSGNDAFPAKKPTAPIGEMEKFANEIWAQAESEIKLLEKTASDPVVTSTLPTPSVESRMLCCVIF